MFGYWAMQLVNPAQSRDLIAHFFRLFEIIMLYRVCCYHYV